MIAAGLIEMHARAPLGTELVLTEVACKIEDIRAGRAKAADLPVRARFEEPAPIRRYPADHVEVQRQHDHKEMFPSSREVPLQVAHQSRESRVRSRRDVRPPHIVTQEHRVVRNRLGTRRCRSFAGESARGDPPIVRVASPLEAECALLPCRLGAQAAPQVSQARRPEDRIIRDQEFVGYELAIGWRGPIVEPGIGERQHHIADRGGAAGHRRDIQGVGNRLAHDRQIDHAAPAEIAQHRGHIALIVIAGRDVVDRRRAGERDRRLRAVQQNEPAQLSGGWIGQREQQERAGDDDRGKNPRSHGVAQTRSRTSRPHRRDHPLAASFF